ncbi:MAG: hypothetical protein JXR94_23865 [Candidatus Hydrogenedentes bacterium]|nr:hypothetical protein [Candidatus Hydrogenedentota bacterium]
MIRITMAALSVLSAAVAAADTSAKPSQYKTDMAAFLEELDNSYPFFELKGIREDWNALRPILTERAAACSTDSEFLGVVVDAIQGLRDSHVWVRDAKAELPPRPNRYYPGVSFMPATRGRVVVMWAGDTYAGTLKPGTVIARIDGRDARAYLEERGMAAWPTSFSSSPQRARLFEFRIPLQGDEGDSHTLTYLAEGEERELTVRCDTEARGWPHTYNLPAGLGRAGRSFYFTQLPDGAGYMYLRRVDESIHGGIRQAVDTFPDASGWIVDLRGNGGGGYDDALINQVKAMPRPVAVLIDAGCVSAGETLARDFVRYAGARLFGSATGGSSSSKRTWTFPSGIASVTLPTRSRWGIDGEPIEFNGIAPDVPVEAEPEDVAQGLNTAIRKAQEYLAEKTHLRTNAGG